MRSRHGFQHAGFVDGVVEYTGTVTPVAIRVAKCKLSILKLGKNHMKMLLIAISFALLMAEPAAAKEHACAAQARSLAGELLKLHFRSDEIAKQSKEPSGEMQNSSIDKSVKTLKPIKAAVGKGMFDVLEVNGNIYKTTYRMRFIFAQGSGSCSLMGQEILELSNPY